MNRRSSTLAAALVLSISLILVMADSGSENLLDGTSWRLAGWTVSSLDPADFLITANFSDGQISGNSGANSYSGPYHAGPDGSFETGELAGTLMAGPEPAMRAESAFLDLLRQARSCKMVNGRLTLLDEDGNPLLIFEAAGDQAGLQQGEPPSENRFPGSGAGHSQGD